jgi:hypothetical protein
MRAARAATSPALLGTSEARLRLPGRAFAEPMVACIASRTTGGLRGRRCPLGAISGATRSAAPGSARASALRELTCRGCLNAVSAANEVSSAARPWREHRSGVGLQGRPPRHEPPAGSACRDARTLHERTSAKGRKRAAPAAERPHRGARRRQGRRRDGRGGGRAVAGRCAAVGLVVTRYDHVPPAYKAQPGRIEVVEAAHPVPDEAGRRAAQRIAELTRGLTRRRPGAVPDLRRRLGAAVLPAPGLTLETSRPSTRRC